MDLPPMQGKWDYKESRIWVNDQEITPPVWTATHREKSNEIPLGNENCVSRKPTPVHLEKGWNKVFMKLPVGTFCMIVIRNHCLLLKMAWEQQIVLKKTRKFMMITE